MTQDNLLEIASLAIKYKEAYELTQNRINSDEIWYYSEADLDDIDTAEILAQDELFRVIDRIKKEK